MTCCMVCCCPTLSIALTRKWTREKYGIEEDDVSIAGRSYNELCQKKRIEPNEYEKETEREIERESEYTKFLAHKLSYSKPNIVNISIPNIVPIYEMSFNLRFWAKTALIISILSKRIYMN